jgi:2'-5' RNA ligase
MKLLTRPGHAPVDPAAAGVTTVGLYAGVTVYLPERIAALLPESRPGVRPHITLAHSQVTLDQARRLHGAFVGGVYATSLAGLRPFPVRLRGSADFRTGQEKPMPVVFLQVADGADQLAELAMSLDLEFGLNRRFDFHPHVTLAWGRDLDDPVLDQLAEAFADFEDEFQVLSLAFATAHGTTTEPRRITWHQPNHHALT